MYLTVCVKLLLCQAFSLACSSCAFPVCSTRDVFDRDYVTPVRVVEDGVFVRLLPSPAEANSAAVVSQETSLDNALAARLLLEWGMAQHFFGKVNSCRRDVYVVFPGCFMSYLCPRVRYGWCFLPKLCVCMFVVTITKYGRFCTSTACIFMCSSCLEARFL